MWLRACAFDIVWPQHTHNHVKKHAKMARNISDEINLDKELQLFLLEGSKSDVWEYLVSLPQVENAQNLYPNFSFLIMIVFTVIQVSIKYRDGSKFHYRTALLLYLHNHYSKPKSNAITNLVVPGQNILS